MQVEYISDHKEMDERHTLVQIKVSLQYSLKKGLFEDDASILNCIFFRINTACWPAMYPLLP